MTTAIPADAGRFRMKILPGTIFVLVGSLVLGIIGFLCLLMAKHGFQVIHWAGFAKSVLATIPIIFAFALLAASALSWLMPSYISANGIHGHTFLGIRCFVSWAEINSARRFELGNLAYVRLYPAGNGPVLWLPLFQKPPVEFQNEIRKFAPAGSPILAHLR